MSITKKYDLVVVGAGAAGMAAAIFAARSGASVAIIEHREKCGRKLAITGKGRCNVTNNTDANGIIKNVITNPKFLFGAVNKFTPADVMSLFEQLGVPLKTERGNRVFPVSDRAYDIVDALVNEMRRLNVTVISDNALAVITENSAAIGVKCEGDSYFADKIILATGGVSYPVTGSDGSGFKIARQLGHTITPLRPALVPLETAENCAQMMGLSLKNVRLSLVNLHNNKTLFSEQGEMLFTHFGVSGPLVLSASCFITDKNPPADKYKLFIDLKPALDLKTLDLRLQRELKEQNAKQLRNIMRTLIPEKLVAPFLLAAELRGDKNASEVTKTERTAIAGLLKNYPLTVTRFRPLDEAIITDGGVSVKEINPKNMESKLVNGLHFAGEIIDICALTGGYNLQLAFSTAYSAASI